MVVPAYNEEGNLARLVVDLQRELPFLAVPFEILLVDDGSTDATGPLADRLAAEHAWVQALHHARNRGYGAAIRTGLREARHDWVIVIPSDLQFTARDVRRLWDARDGTDVVASYRARRVDPWPRSVASFVYRSLMRILYGVKQRDINWVKLWRRAAVLSMEVETSGFVVDGELLAKAARLGLATREVGVPHYPRAWGTPAAGLRVGVVLRTLREMAAIRGMLRRMDDADDGARPAAPVAAGGRDAAGPR